MHILFDQELNSFWRKNLEQLKAELPEHHYYTKEEIAQGKPYPGIETVDIIIGGKPDRAQVEAAKNLKLIIVPFAGINHLPMDLLVERKIRVANSHGNAPDVAERTLALMLAWYGKIIEYHHDLQQGRWHGFWVGQGLQDTWQSIRGSRCSILGTGEIAKELVKLLAPLEVTCTGYRRNINAPAPPGFHRITNNLPEAIAEADTLIIALPATEATTGLIGPEELSQMEGKLLVNVGRGPIVQEEALARALEQGTLAGAAIDCWYNYPQNGQTEGFPARQEIYTNPQVVLSPHVAGFTSQAAKRNIDQGFENLRRFLREGTPLFEANPAGGY